MIWRVERRGAKKRFLGWLTLKEGNQVEPEPQCKTMDARTQHLEANQRIEDLVEPR